MKKYLLLLLFVTLSFSSAFAVEGLNPYAYKLEYVGQSDYNRKMTLKYWLNAPAKSVSITVSYMLDDAQQVVSYVGTTNEGENTVTVSTAGLPANTPLSWSITVNQTTKTKPTQVSQSYRFYCPHGVAVDKDPQSEYFGRILVTESLHKRTGTSGRDYVSSTSATGGTIQAGLYAFTPRFKLENSKGVPYKDKDGMDFTQKLGKFTSGYGTFDGGHQPYQIKISNDGRIFVSSGDIRDKGVVVWELSKDLQEWTPIIRNQGGAGFNSNYQLLNDGKFYAGFNCSMDVKGSGENLKLLLYSADYDGVRNHHSSNFRLDEYAIGNYTGEEFNGTINTIWKPGDKKYGVVYDNVNVIYDGEGGYWLGANRAVENDKQPNLVHINSNKVQDQYSYSADFFGGAGVMLHTATYPDRKGERWLFKGLSRSTTENGRFGIWKLTKGSDGKTTRSRIWTVTSTGLGRNHNAFALDYAENLYVVGNNGERIVAFALPYEGTKTTPAKSTIKLQPVAVDNSQTFQVTINVTPAGAGTATGEGRYHYMEQVVVTATPSDPNRYEFVRWVANENHPENPFSFKITGDVTITAEFKKKEYKVEFFNLFQNHEDITDYYSSDVSEDAARNTRIWRLFQVQFNNRFDPNHSDYDDFTNDNSKGKWAVMKFLDTETSTGTETRSDLMPKIERFVDQEYTFEAAKNSFYWLGQYLEYVVKYLSGGIKTDIHAYEDANGITNIWAFYLQAFFNRDVLYNRSYETHMTSLPNSYPAKNVTFAQLGLPDYWRKWWQQIDCKLDTTWNYDKAMPVEWAYRPFNGTTYIKIDNTSKNYYPSSWFRWNNDTAQTNQGKLLGWYYGEKNPDTWTDNPDEVDIVHNINKNGNLIAIWIPKDIHEEKNNYDVAKLMTTQGTTHDVRVYHPLQKDMYNTVCLPFNVESLPSDLAGATVLRLVGSELSDQELTEETLTNNSVNLYFEQVDFAKGEQMYAGYPYLIMPQSDITGWVTFPGVNRDSVYTGEGKTIVTDYVSMHGHINPSTIEVDPNTLFLVTDNRLATPSESGVMLGLRGYFTLEGSAAAYSLSESAMHIGKKVTTDTPDAPEVEEEVETTQPAAPKTSKIMYQGNIYILRGDEVYTLTGHRVK